MDEEFTIAVFSPNDPRPWVRKENTKMMLDHEAKLINALKGKGYKLVRGGDGFIESDQIAWNTKLVQEHIKRISESNPSVLIVNQGSWTFPYDTIDAVKLLSALSKEIPRVIMFCYKDTTVPGLVAGMSAGGGLKRIGVPFVTCYGKIDEDPKVLDDLEEVIGFYRKRWESKNAVRRVLDELPFQKYVAFGGMSLKMATTTADVDQWQKIFGVSYEALDQSVLTDRALEMVSWEGFPGASPYHIHDIRIEKALEYTLSGGHGVFDFSREKMTGPEKFVLQIAYYFAAFDIITDSGATFAGIKCQDELSAKYCTVCPAAAFLNNDVGPDGRKKPIIPVACENDMDSALTQLLLHLLSGQPAGFGDFRDIENGVLAIINCGQHPPYFFGTPSEEPETKLNRTEYLGQEYYYLAGGSAVRGRTPGGQTITVARLGRQNLRYELVATVIETIDVHPSEYEKYTPSWPIIKGKTPVDDDVLIEAWPCNHLAFTFGDWTAALAEISQNLQIGFRIFDKNGREYRNAP